MVSHQEQGDAICLIVGELIIILYGLQYLGGLVKIQVLIAALYNKSL